MKRGLKLLRGPDETVVLGCSSVLRVQELREAVGSGMSCALGHVDAFANDQWAYEVPSPIVRALADTHPENAPVVAGDTRKRETRVELREAARIALERNLRLFVHLSS